jgi:hypothetical protein
VSSMVGTAAELGPAADVHVCSSRSGD